MSITEIIYIHPRSLQTGRDAIVPMGALTTISAIHGNKLGLFEAEVKDSHLRAAKVVLMDIHWHFSLVSGMRLAERVRRVNRDVKIIAGGYTASIFARQITRESEIDYVVRGDTDDVLPELVEQLGNGGDGHNLPNVTGKYFENHISKVMTPERYGQMEFIEPLWFPTLVKMMRFYQRNFYPTYTYPFVPVSRGCAFHCETCYGNPKFQKIICGRDIVFRPGESIVGDMRRIERMEGMRLVYIIGDLDTYRNAKNAEIVLGNKYNLNLYYEYFDTPTSEHLNAISAAFNYVFICLFTVKMHFATDSVIDMEAMEAAVAKVYGKNVNCTLFVNPDLEDNNPGYARKVLQIRRKYGCDLFNMKTYIATLSTDIPYPGEDSEEREQQFIVFLKKNRRDTATLWLRRTLLHRVFFSDTLTWLARKTHTMMTEAEMKRKASK
jgi:hypothetical protein